MKIEVSSKHIKLRIAIVAVAFVVAVTAFTVGVVSIGKKSPGYHLIEARIDSETVLANQAVSFKYWFDGKSNQIKHGIRAVTEEYSSVFLACYRQLDNQNTYTGQVGIATINKNAGTDVFVSAELYDLLKDAYRRTCEKKGFNMFAGALYAEWQKILILDEPDEFDPAVNGQIAGRISDIARTVSDLDNFSLEFLDDEKHRVRFSVSPAYEQFCKEYEIDAYALDLNILKDAYLLQMVAAALSRDGFNDGYLYTAEGLVVNMRADSTLGYDMYTLADGKETVYASLNLDGVFSAATITAFGMGSHYHYTLTADNSNNRALYRNRYFNVATGGFADIILSETIVSPDLNPVEVVYQGIIMNNLASETEVKAYASSLEKSGTIVSYVFQSVL